MYTETNSENTRKQGSVPVFTVHLLCGCWVGVYVRDATIQYGSICMFLVLYKEKKILFLNPQMYLFY